MIFHIKTTVAHFLLLLIKLFQRISREKKKLILFLRHKFSFLLDIIKRKYSESNIFTHSIKVFTRNITMSSNNNTSFTLAILQFQSAFRYSSLILGFILLIGGVLGNILNIIVFIKFGNYKNNACSLYMFVRAFIDLYILLAGLATRILTTGFQIDFTLMNRIWCKTRIGFLDINSQRTYTLICLQAIDAFMCSSPSVVVRQKSNIRIARYLIVGTLCFWFIHEIPYFILQELVIVGGTPMCITTNTIFAQYRSYFVALCIVTIIPIIVVSIFGFFTVRHMKTISVTRSLSSLTR